MDEATLKKIKDIVDEAVEDRKAYRSGVDRIRTEARAFHLICAALGVKLDDEPKKEP